MKNALRRIWKAVTMVYSKYYLSICLEGLSNTMITLRLAKHSQIKVYSVIATPAFSVIGQQMLGPRVGTWGACGNTDWSVPAIWPSPPPPTRQLKKKVSVKACFILKYITGARLNHGRGWHSHCSLKCEVPSACNMNLVCVWTAITGLSHGGATVKNTQTKNTFSEQRQTTQNKSK